MTELSFLIDLLLTKKLPTEIKTKVIERIKEVEEKYTTSPQANIPPIFQRPPITQQAPSTQKILDEMAMNPEPTASPPQAITPAAIKAANERQQVLAQAISGKTEPGRTSPRKF